MDARNDRERQSNCFMVFFVKALCFKYNFNEIFSNENVAGKNVSRCIEMFRHLYAKNDLSIMLKGFSRQLS